ncbi:MAG: 3-hydroxybutyryl-CoA dehydrogenase, partial [Halovenus sp.]
MHVAVLGAGTMGHGIAQLSAMAGHQVQLRDIEAELVEEGLAAVESNLDGGIERDKLTEQQKLETLDRLQGTTTLETAVADANVVIEAVPEDIEIKHQTLTDVEAHVSQNALLASNTSSLSLTEIADALEYPERA